MPAEIGRGAAGFTNIVTRSGASGFHGSFFEFVRNSAFDARNYFDHPTLAYPGRIPPFRRNEFGFTNGGPVILPHVYDGRKRTFYFAQYQGFRQVLGTTQVMPVPTAAERTGLDTSLTPTAPAIRSRSRRSRHRRRAGALSAAQLPPGAFGSAHLRNRLQGRHRRQSVFAAPRPQDSPAKTSSLRASTSTTSPVPPPIPTRRPSIPAFGIQYIDRQRNVVGTYTRTVSPRLTLESPSASRAPRRAFPRPTTPTPRSNSTTDSLKPSTPPPVP